MMKKIVRDKTIELIKKYLPEMNVTLPLKNEDDVEIICDFFENMEREMSNALGYGDSVDRALLNDASDAFDDLAIIYEEDYHDLDDLNRRLQ